ncbi:MAG: SDR family NAD(P)-dependent oxidoreductase [Rhizomicrobium sp.]|nr:SDR family NAD(P)-dependent oxidoreductase [Rhizomicrobium sp.]
MPHSMTGKTVVITGGTSGIGEVAAVSLAGMGARIVLVARDDARAASTLQKLAAANPAVTHAVHIADLFSLYEMKRVAAKIAEAEPRIDVLINNAGAYFEERETTVDELECSFALNHMAYFVITNGLLERLKATPGARIVSTASDAHKMARLDLDDLQSEKRYNGFRTYGTTKLMNILFTRQLAMRLEGTGVAAYCLHPGFVATRFADNNDGFMGSLFSILKRIWAISPQKGAQTIIYLASTEAALGKSGTYWYKRRCVAPTKAARSDRDAARLWALSEGIAYG